MKYKILTIIIAAVLVNFCFVNGASAGWTEGKFGSAFEFDGVNDYVSVLDPLGNVKTVSFWIKADSTTEKIMEMKSGTYIEVSGGTITATGFTSPTIFVDGVVGSTIDTDWHHIAITTDADVDASAVKIGKVATDYFTGTLDEVKIYPYARSADEVRLDYNAGVATHLGPSGKTCAEDPASCMDYGLVGSWNMDEGTGDTAYDSSDEGNDGSLEGGTAWGKGKEGGGLQFDGVNDYIDCGNDESLDITDAITISAWVKGNPTQNSIYAVISKGHSGAGYGWVIQSVNDVDLYFVTGNSAGYEKVNFTGFQPKDSIWHHLVAVKSTIEGMFAYKDGVLLDSDATALSAIDYGSGYTFSIGKDTFNPDRHFNGTIDEVRIYDRALTADEVRWHYNRGGPVASWDFDEGSGQTAFDGVGDADGQLGSDSASAGDVNDPGWSVP